VLRRRPLGCRYSRGPSRQSFSGETSPRGTRTAISPPQLSGPQMNEMNTEAVPGGTDAPMPDALGAVARPAACRAGGGA
jgi:hypothetical protein